MAEFLIPRFMKKAGDWSTLVGLSGLLLTISLLSLPAHQSLALEVAIKDSHNSDLDLWLQVTKKRASKRKIKTEELDKMEQAKVPGFEVYYIYKEELLMPGSRNDDRVPCYLYVYVVDLSDNKVIDNSEVEIMEHKFLLRVEGDSFIDQSVEAPLEIRKDNHTSSGKIKLIVHQEYPDKALSKEARASSCSKSKPGVAPEDPVICASTGKRSDHDIVFSNESCCDVELIEAELAHDLDKELWKQVELKAFAEGLLRPSSTGPGIAWLSLVVEPHPIAAFFRSFRPYDEDSPHAELKFKINYKVRNGGKTTIQKNFRVRFEPSSPILLAGLVAGALLGATLGLMFIGFRHGGESIYGRDDSAMGKIFELFKRAFSSVTVAIAVYFLYLFVKGGKEVVIFDYPLDPDQLPPTFLIGLIVGSRPDVYFGIMTGKRKRRENIQGSLLLLMVLAMSSPSHAQSFHATELDYDKDSDALFVLTRLPNTIFLLDSKRQEFQRITKIDYKEEQSDFCLTRWRDADYVTSISRRRVKAASPVREWRLSTRALSPGAPVITPFSEVSFLRFTHIACKEDRPTVLTIENSQSILYSISLDDHGSWGKAQRLCDQRFRAPRSIAIVGDRIFVGEGRQGSVWEVEAATCRARRLHGEVGDPADMTVTPDGARLLVADAENAWILSYDLKSGGEPEKMERRDLREPLAVQMDTRGHLWVIDRWAGALLEYPPGEDQAIRHRP